MYAGLASSGGFSGWLTAQALIGRNLSIRRSYTELELPASFSQSPCGADVGQTNVWSAYNFAGKLPKSGDATYAADVAAIQAVLLGLKNRSYDAAIKAWVASIPSDHYVDIGIMHEVDVKVQQGVYTSQAAVDAWTGFAATIAALRTANAPGITRVRTVCCMTAYNFQATASGVVLRTDAGSSPSLDTCLNLADVIAVDGYGKGKTSASGVFNNFFTYAGVNYPNKPRVIWEFSTSPDQPGGRPQWITDVFALAYAGGCDYLSGFNSAVGGSSPLIGDTASAAAFAAAMDSYTVPFNPTGQPTQPRPSAYGGMPGSLLWVTGLTASTVVTPPTSDLTATVNPDGTVTFSGTGATVNPDGTATLSSASLVANPDGTYSLTAS